MGRGQIQGEISQPPSDPMLLCSRGLESVVLHLSSAGNNEYPTRSAKRRGGSAPFVPQTPGSASVAIIQCEWRLDLSSSPPRCSLSLRPLARPRRRERDCLPACRRGMVGPRGREWERGPRAGEQCLGRAVFGPCPRGPSAPPGQRWAWTRGSQFASTWWMKIPSFGRRGP